MADKNKMFEKFKAHNKIIPKFFIRLSNQLKSNKKIESVFRYTEMHVAGNFSIEDIKTIIKKNKKKKPKKPQRRKSVWTVRKK